ncbi:MAG TPA: hypothetical protein VNA31_04305 [bacterium]|nr:hypothetical protein [bacterium]
MTAHYSGVSMYWWGHGLSVAAGLVWLAAVAYVLTLATRLVRAIERIANKFESKS